MRADTQEKKILIATIFLLVAAGAVFTLQTLDPGAYNQITGQATTVGTTVNITNATPMNCDFTLREGMNLVSFLCIGDFYSVSEAMTNVSNLTAVWGYEKGSGDPWKVYNPNLPDNVVNDLSSLSKRKGYWVKMQRDESLFIEGFLPASNSISLTQGYNLVGYPKNESESVNTSFNSISGSFTKVVGFDPDTKTFEIYEPGSGGSLTETEPNRGYWINATTSDTWVVS